MTDSLDSIFKTLIDAAEQTYASCPALQAFMPWPDDLSLNNPDLAQSMTAKDIPALDAIKAFPSDHPLVKVWQVCADHLYWKQSYTEDQVGRHFLNHYGYVEIFGPTGLYHSNQARGFIGYWGADLYYPAHHHAAEEIYLVLGGSVTFETPGQGGELCLPEKTRYHQSQQVHAMQVGAEGFLTFALWRGEDMALPPQISPHAQS